MIVPILFGFIVGCLLMYVVLTCVDKEE